MPPSPTPHTLDLILPVETHTLVLLFKSCSCEGTQKKDRIKFHHSEISIQSEYTFSIVNSLQVKWVKWFSLCVKNNNCTILVQIDVQDDELS